MSRMVGVVLIIAMSQFAISQVGTGSILVFELLKDKFIIAADSRQTLDSRHSDGACKIAAFSDHVVFGVTNGPKYIPFPHDSAPAWDAMKEVQNVLRTDSPQGGNATSRVAHIADTWAILMQSDWRNLFLLHPDLVRKVAQSQNGGLTHGVFALAVHGSIAFAAREINFSDGQIAAGTPNIENSCRDAACATGILNVFGEFTQKTSERAKQENWNAPNSSNETADDILKIVRLVDLTIAYDPSGTVGGSIDALELHADGSVHWLQHPNCPETYQ